MNDSLFLNALQCRNEGRPPVWLMRQAGRYLPQFRALRQKRALLDLFTDAESIAEVTKMPIDLLGFDAAILFSDILLVLECFEAGLHFVEGKGPVFDHPVTDLKAVQQACFEPIESVMKPVADGIRLLRQELEVPLIGFAGGPFTVASYWITGGSSKDNKAIRQWMVRDPATLHLLLDKVTQATIAWLNMQIDAGVQAIQLFDTWAHVLGGAMLQEFSLQYLHKVMQGLKDPTIPVILFGLGTSRYATQLLPLQPAAISLDWHCDLAQMRTQIPSSIALQGNFDPYLLYGTPERVRSEVERVLASMQEDKGYIVNLGHGLLPDIPVENVRLLVETVKQAPIGILA